MKVYVVNSRIDYAESWGVDGVFSSKALAWKHYREKRQLWPEYDFHISVFTLDDPETKDWIFWSEGAREWNSLYYTSQIEGR